MNVSLAVAIVAITIGLMSIGLSYFVYTSYNTVQADRSEKQTQSLNARIVSLEQKIAEQESTINQLRLQQNITNEAIARVGNNLTSLNYVIHYNPVQEGQSILNQELALPADGYEYYPFSAPEGTSNATFVFYATAASLAGNFSITVFPETDFKIWNSTHEYRNRQVYIGPYDPTSTISTSTHVPSGQILYLVIANKMNGPIRINVVADIVYTKPRPFTLIR